MVTGKNQPSRIVGERLNFLGRGARASRLFFVYDEIRVAICVELTLEPSGAAPLYEVSHSLGSGGAGGTVFEESGELGGIAGRREAGLAGADHGKRFIGGKMGQSFLERTGEMRERGAGRDAQNGFAEAKDAVGGLLESLRDRVVRRAGDNDLQRMIRKERCREAVSCSEEAILRGNPGEGFERFAGERVVALVASECVETNECDGGDGICAGCGGILERLAANVEATHGSGVGGAVEKAAAFGIAVSGNR